MKRDNSTPFTYDVDEDFDFIVDEKPGGNSFIALRKVAWGDSDKHRLDIRKWMTGSDGKEIPGKGVSFMDEDKGPNELIKVLLSNGYGKTKDTLMAIKDREDFSHCLDIALGKIKDEEVDDESTYYDPKEALL